MMIRFIKKKMRKISDKSVFFRFKRYYQKYQDYKREHNEQGTAWFSLCCCANWRGYSWRQLELSPDFQSLQTQNIYIEKLVGRDWKKEELGESSKD
jgi:hypothetical protein